MKITSKIPIERTLLKALTQPAPVRLLLQTAIEWISIVVLILIASRYDNLTITLGCVLLIATRQHALLTLMHEYSHFQFSRKYAGWNDLLGNVFTAFPFFITVYGFRRNHQLHHRNAWTDDDPNYVAAMMKVRYQFPKPNHQVWFEIVKHAVGYYTLAELKRYTINAGMATSLPRTTHLHRALFAIVLFTVVTYFGWWKDVLMYWLLPMSTFLMAILYIRDLGEHFGLAKPGIDSSRTVLTGWIDRLLFAQNGVNFHTEHHCYPAVPFFRLQLLHDTLMRNPAYRNHAVVTDGYLSGVITELSNNAALSQQR